MLLTWYCTHGADACKWYCLPQMMDEVKLGPMIGSGSNGRCYRGTWHGGSVAVKVRCARCAALLLCCA